MGLLASAHPSASDVGDALVRRAARGEKAAFDALVTARSDRCYRLARSILANDADAADATQDAFVAAWCELPRLRQTAAFDGWLNRIVANTSLMARRHRSRRREVFASLDTPDSDESPSWEPESVARTYESDAFVERDAMGRAFGRLRPGDRAILVLHHVDERPVCDVARALNVPVGTAKWRLHAARKALVRAIEAESPAQGRAGSLR
jgi:RNA polymerase sigma-70 factor, ECF subfamily